MTLKNKIAVLMVLLPGLASLMACNSLSRHPDSGYSTYGSHKPLYIQLERERAAYKESMAREELGMGNGYPLTENEQMALRQRMLLQNKENRLSTHKEKKQYYFYKPLMKTDQERIYFLNLPSVEARERFVHQRGIAGMVNEVPEQIAEQIEDNDISVGMSQKAVLESWGDPDGVEVSGNPVYGNERWKYSKYVSSDAGYRRELRFVYFENGVVSGWESF